MSRKAGARKRYDTRTSTMVRFDPDLHARLTEAAAERDVSMNWLVNRAVARYLDDLVPVDQIVLTRSERAAAPEDER